jgi:hypothetical protein
VYGASCTLQHPQLLGNLMPRVASLELGQSGMQAEWRSATALKALSLFDATRLKAGPVESDETIAVRMCEYSNRRQRRAALGTTVHREDAYHCAHQRTCLSASQGWVLPL